jgi:hypothetical protein
MKAIGGAVSIDFERMLDGAESLAEFMDVLVEAQEDAIYAEVQKALMGAFSSMKAANKVTFGATFDPAAMMRLVNVVKAYGGSAVIFAAPEFIDWMGPDAIISATANVQGIYNPKDIEDIANTGRIKMFRGTPVVELKQSFADEDNDELMINPYYAYVLPAGKEKVVKILMEGQTQMYDATNRDNSIEINVYRKIGVGVVSQNNWGIARRYEAMTTTTAGQYKYDAADAKNATGTIIDGVNNDITMDINDESLGLNLGDDYMAKN